MGIPAKLVSRFSSPDLGRDLTPTSLAPCLRYWLAGNEVHVLDESLAISFSRSIPVFKGARLRAANPDLSRLIIATSQGTHWIAGDVECEFPVLADSASILPGGEAILTAPTGDGSHRVLLVDRDGTVKDEQTVPVAQAGAIAEQHPSDGSVVIDFGEGQDGSLLVVAGAQGSRLDVTEIGANTSCAGFSPDGERLLLMPHPSFPAAPRTMSWPSMHEAGVVEGLEVDFDLYGSYLSPTRVILKSYDEGLFIADRDLAETTAVTLNGPDFDENHEIESVFGISSTRFGATIWIGGRSQGTLWELSG